MINWARVADLRQDFGDDGFPEVIEVFLAEVATGQDRLASATTPDAMRAEFHFIKGAALNMGFDSIAKLCEQGEAMAEQGQMALAQRDQILSDLPRACAEFSENWRRMLGMPPD